MYINECMYNLQHRSIYTKTHRRNIVHLRPRICLYLLQDLNIASLHLSCCICLLLFKVYNDEITHFSSNTILQTFTQAASTKLYIVTYCNDWNKRIIDILSTPPRLITRTAQDVCQFHWYHNY